MKIFVAGYDVMGKRMAGPGIRSLAIASFLTQSESVTLSHDESSELENIDQNIRTIRESDVPWGDEKFWRGFDAAIIPGTQMLKTSLPMPFPIPLYVDIYDPFILENIEMLSSSIPQVRDFEYLRHLKALLEMLIRSDYFIVTGERTLDFFTGMLSALGIVNPVNASKQGFEKLFLTIPFGIPDESFEDALSKSSVKLPEFIQEKDELIVWAGGLWDWLDPLKAVDAIPLILDKRPQVKLLFPGYKHPNKHIPLMESAKQCIEKSKKLGLYDKSIFFNEWTPFAERISFLGRANLGLSLHKKHIETRYAYRTRIMDYIWARLPMVISGGDNLALDLMIPGVTVIEPGSDASTVADSILSTLDYASNPQNKIIIRDAFKSKQAKYKWSEILKPLKESLQKAGKTNSEFYATAFHQMLKHFPEVSKPGIITKGIEKIKKRF